MSVNRSKLEREYPANEGWVIIEIGNKVIAHNKWGGARIVVAEKPVKKDQGLWPRSWRIKG